MGLASDRTIISGANYHVHACRLALSPIHLSHLRERSRCSSTAPGDVRSERQSADEQTQLGTSATPEPARDACSQDSRGFAEGGRRAGQQGSGASLEPLVQPQDRKRCWHWHEITERPLVIGFQKHRTLFYHL